MTAPIDQRVRDEIRTELDRNLCVEAGAGTGKTTSLVARIVELLGSGHCGIDELAVITFTDKAAAELSTRVREQLEAAAIDEGEPGRRERLGAAARALYRAKIQTIHSFASDVLRERPVEAGLDPGFQVMSDLESSLSFDAAYERWLDDLLAGEHPEVERALNLGFGMDEIRETAEAVHRQRFLLPFEPFDEPSADADDVSTWFEQHLDELRGIEGQCIDDEDRGLPGLRALISRGEQFLQEGVSASARERLAALGPKPPPKTYGKRGSWDNPADCGRMKELKGDYADLRERVQEDLRAAALLAVLPHVEKFVADYAEQRRREGTADFDDLIIWAARLLRDNLDVRHYFQRRFKCLLIDEFQDTDPLQVEIATFIASDDQDATDWRELTPTPGKLFVVGDPKQSIYRFRRADIAIYDEVKTGALDGGLKEIVQNFRSVPGVLDWVNEAFDRLLVEEEGLQPRNVHLEPSDAELELGRPPVVVLRGGDDTLNSAGVRAAEAAGITDLLWRAVEVDHWPVRDRLSDEPREATWRDVAILLPTRTGLEIYEDALAAAGIPYRHEGSRDYFQRQEVRDLIFLLRGLDDPSDYYSVIGALRSSAFGCSDDDVVIHLATKAPLDFRVDVASDSVAVKEAFALLRDLHRARGRLSLPELVHRIISESRLVEVGLTQPDGAQAAANLLAVSNQARAFAAAASGGALRAFTRWLADSTENEATEMDAGITEEADNVVRLMTMHGAKGLEFPIVVLANLTGRPRQDREPVPDEPDSQLHFRVGSGGPGRTGHYATPGYQEAWDGEKAALDAERIRLLYVAATRARDHLFIPAFVGKQTPGPFLAALEPCLSEQVGHELEADGAWVLDAGQLTPAPEDGEEAYEDVDTETLSAAAKAKDEWIGEREAVVGDARRELPLVVASSVDRATRPLSAEASHSGATLLVSDGPPLPVGDALHLVMERVSLPEAEDLEAVAAAVCAEAGLSDRQDEVLEMAHRCLGSSAVQAAVSSGACKREVPFTVARNGGFATGRVDLVYPGAEGLVVIDYKTDEVSAEEAAAHAVTSHGGQVAEYSRALGSATRLAVERVVMVFCRTGVEVAVAPAHEELPT